MLVLGAVLGLAGAAIANAVTPVTYQAQVQQFVSFSESGDSSANALSGAQFTLQRVKSYTEVATSAQVLAPVIRDLRLPDTPAGLAQRVTATNPLDTVLIQISVTDTSPARAAQIANALAAQFATFVTGLEQTPEGGQSPVKVSITEPAVVPGAPVTPRRGLNFALGLLAGLALGAGGTILRSRFDRRVSSAEDVIRLTGAEPLGEVPLDADTPQHPLVLHDLGSARAEAFRALRTNLQFANVDHPPRVFVVTSAQPSEGKSTSACNIALTLAIGGARVLLIEGDLRRPAASNYLGLDNTVGLTNVLAGQIDVEDAICSWSRNTMWVLPSGPIPPNPSELLGSQQMAALLDSLRESYDYVVIDAPPLNPVTDAAVAAALTDGALLIVRHGSTTVDAAERALGALRSVNAHVIGTAVTFVPPKRRFGLWGGATGYGYGYGEGYGSTAGRQAVAPENAEPVRSVASLENRAPLAVRGPSVDHRAAQSDVTAWLAGLSPAPEQRRAPAGSSDTIRYHSDGDEQVWVDLRDAEPVVPEITSGSRAGRHRRD